MHWEAHLNAHFHQLGIPVLVSASFLRRYGCGQIDLAIITKRNKEHYLKVVEAKSSMMAGRAQVRRLYLSVEMISKYLNIPGGLEQFCASDYLPNPGGVLKL